MAQGDFGLVPNVWRPQFVPPINTGEDTGVGRQVTGSGGSTTTTTTESGDFTSRWVLIFNAIGGGTDSLTFVDMARFTCPADASQLLILIWYDFFTGNGGNAASHWQVIHTKSGAVVSSDNTNGLRTGDQTNNRCQAMFRFSLGGNFGGLRLISQDFAFGRQPGVADFTAGFFGPTPDTADIYDPLGAAVSGSFGLTIQARVQASGTTFEPRRRIRLAAEASSPVPNSANPGAEPHIMVFRM